MLSHQYLLCIVFFESSCFFSKSVFNILFTISFAYESFHLVNAFFRLDFLDQQVDLRSSYQLLQNTYFLSHPFPAVITYSCKIRSTIARSVIAELVARNSISSKNALARNHIPPVSIHVVQLSTDVCIQCGHRPSPAFRHPRPTHQSSSKSNYAVFHFSGSSSWVHQQLRFPYSYVPGIFKI